MTRTEMMNNEATADELSIRLAEFPTAHHRYEDPNREERRDLRVEIDRLRSMVGEERTARFNRAVNTLVGLVESDSRDNDPVAGANREGLMLAAARLCHIDETHENTGYRYHLYTAEHVWSAVRRVFAQRCEFAGEFKPAGRVDRVGVDGLVEEYLERRGGDLGRDQIAVALLLPGRWVAMSLKSLTDVDRVQRTGYGRSKAWRWYAPAQRAADEAYTEHRKNVSAMCKAQLADLYGDDWEDVATVRFSGDVMIDGDKFLELLARMYNAEGATEAAASGVRAMNVTAIDDEEGNHS